MQHYNILICGVGGTGVIGLGRLIRDAARREGGRVVSAESRGSGQRGGPATTSVRFTKFDRNETDNDRIALWSGAVDVGGADLMIATEASEALRNALYLSEKSKVLLNTFALKPSQTREEIKTGRLRYPSIQEIVANLKKLTAHVCVAHASDMSMKRFKTYRNTNPILAGMAIAWNLLPLQKETMKGLLTGTAKEALEVGFKSQIPQSD